ncbi:MAG: WG repeat-containing protein [Deltaproteobacteria bacterium]|nr:WG repeat-containing protein [Deltaproteobacteria bacterium]
MQQILLICTFIMFGCSKYPQNDSSWIAFWNDNSELMGFKDQNGKIRIEPKYTGFTTARIFDKIIAVMEEKNGRHETYYLTKSRKTVGTNQVYIFDNGPDCECEGFIRFRDNKTDRVGMFNSEGEVVIPAEYNDLTNVRNGFVIALKGAKKKHSNGNDDSGRNHFTWAEGKKHLIDTNNQIIIENFEYDSDLDFFSIKTEPDPAQDPVRQSFPGADDGYYSFIDYKKEFKKWLDSALLASVSKEKLIESSYRRIYIWKEPIGWTSETSSEFIDANFELIKTRLAELNKEESDYFVSIDGLNPFIYDGIEFNAYYNNCGEPKEWKYPVMNVTVNHKTESDFYQDHFEFLRTENGYRLISVTVRNGILK